jgi:heterodisulfide reductase subunit A-like polyferredoxin
MKLPMSKNLFSRRQFIRGSGGSFLTGIIANSPIAAWAASIRGKAAVNKLNQMPEPDIVFVGAGINSLGAALLLCEAGWKVLVLDRNATPGAGRFAQ